MRGRKEGLPHSNRTNQHPTHDTAVRHSFVSHLHQVPGTTPEGIRITPLFADALVLRSEVALGRGRTGLVLHTRARRHASSLAWPGTAQCSLLGNKNGLPSLLNHCTTSSSSDSSCRQHTAADRQQQNRRTNNNATRTYRTPLTYQYERKCKNRFVIIFIYPRWLYSGSWYTVSNCLQHSCTQTLILFHRDHHRPSSGALGAS